jgi:Protein of unknown function DUF262/Protein of unknown function (DUF1524)
MSDSKSQIVFEQSGLGNVRKQNQLVVPSNQREYSWSDRQTTQLFQDFAKAIADGEVGYFLGTIVTIPRTNGTLEVVDGQQRLATTALLLAAIRDYLKDKDQILVESINNEFLTGIDRTKRARTPRLRLNIDDNELFSWLLAPNGDEPKSARTSHTLLKAAFGEAKKHVQAIISSLDPKVHGDILNSWVTFIEHKALVILLKVPNDSNAYKMFETLNDRGLRTSQADLIKNYLFGRSGDRIQEVQSRWAFMRGALESLEDEAVTVTFLRHALIIMRGYLTSAQVYDAVQDAVKSELASVTFSSTLENLAHSYAATFNSDHEKWNGYPDTVRRSYEVLNLLNIKPMRPLLLAIAAKFDHKNSSLGLQFLVSFGVRLLITNATTSGSVETKIAAAANAIFLETIKSVDQLKTALTDVIPSDEEFRLDFATARISIGKLARYYLRSLETSAKDVGEPWFIPNEDRSVINLEHVLPKKPLLNWPQFNEEEVHVWVHRLGNQALMRATDNSSLASDGFESKKNIYQNSPYLLTSQIAELSSWTPKEIEARQKTLADLATKTWPV